jgi:recombination protein RecR
MTTSQKLDDLIQALRLLPGIGPKSAQRMAFTLLERDRQPAKRIADTINTAVSEVGYCQGCNNFSDTPYCLLCCNTKREQDVLCIVETPADVSAIEQSYGYNGIYFVLMGHLSPIDGIGPDDINLDKLAKRLQTQTFKEIIVATNPTVEGEATAHYIADMIRPSTIKLTRIAYGVPLGGELEYVDGGTLAKALAARDTL